MQTTTIRIAELPPLIKFTAAAKLLGISRQTLSNWVNEGRIGQPTINLSPKNRQFEAARFLADVQAAGKRVRSPT